MHRISMSVRSPGAIMLKLMVVSIAVLACDRSPEKINSRGQRLAVILNGPSADQNPVTGSDDLPRNTQDPVTLPASPSGLKAEAVGVYGIRLTWVPVSFDAALIDVLAIKVYRNSEFLTEIAVSSAEFSDSELEPDTQYSYQLELVHIDGLASERSAIAQARTSSVSGRELYESFCAGCHGELAVSNKSGRSALQIKAAIKDVEAMINLRDALNDAQIGMIAEVLVGSVDRTPPLSPAGLSLKSASPSSITIQWTSAGQDSDGGQIAAIRVYRDMNSVSDLSADLREFNDGTLSADTEYRYQLTSLDQAGNESEKTDILVARTVKIPSVIDTTPPTKPNFNVVESRSISSSVIRLVWSTSTDSESGLKGYEISRGGQMVASLDANAANHLDKNLIANTDFQYSIVAIDYAGNRSQPSNVNIRTSLLNGAMVYADNCAGCHSALANSEKKGRSATQIANAILTNPGMKDITALRDLGDQELAATAAALASAPDTQAPALPTQWNGIAASARSIRLNWNAAVDLGGSGVYAYRIFRGTRFVMSLPSTQLSYTDNGLAPATPYQYSIQVMDGAANQSALANPITITTLSESAVPDTMPPTVPVNLVATTVDHRSIRLSWGASTDGGGAGLSGYRIYRNATMIAEVGGDALSYVDRDLMSNSEFIYEILAFDGASNQSTRTSPVRQRTTIPNGSELYQASCQNCHAPLAQSTKKGASASVIQFGLESQPQMRGINLRNDEVFAIAEALRIPPSQLLPGQHRFNYVMPMGTRHYLHSMFMQSFIHPSINRDSDAMVRSIVESNLLNQVEVQGGPCSRYDVACPGLTQFNTGANQAPMTPVANPLRFGYIAKACQEILSLDGSLRAFLAVSFVNETSVPDSQKIRQLSRNLVPNHVMNAEVVQSILDLGSRARMDGMSSLDQWRMMSLAICESSMVGGF
jgi:mono/diheme cytochrome c family protein